jgi:hypothetical protein
LYPDSSYGWLIPRDELIVDGIVRERDGLAGQHGGRIEATDFWLTPVDPLNVYTWVEPFGGTTDALLAVMKQML